MGDMLAVALVVGTGDAVGAIEVVGTIKAEGAMEIEGCGLGAIVVGATDVVVSGSFTASVDVALTAKNKKIQNCSKDCIDIMMDIIYSFNFCEQY